MSNIKDICTLMKGTNTVINDGDGIKEYGMNRYVCDIGKNKGVKGVMYGNLESITDSDFTRCNNWKDNVSKINNLIIADYNANGVNCKGTLEQRVSLNGGNSCNFSISSTCTTVGTGSGKFKSSNIINSVTNNYAPDDKDPKNNYVIKNKAGFGTQIYTNYDIYN